MSFSCAIVGAAPLSLLPLTPPIRAVCDPSDAFGNALSQKLACSWYTNPMDMLTAHPDVDVLWLRPDSTGAMPFDPALLASFGRHIILDLSLPITPSEYRELALICTRKGSLLHEAFPLLPVMPELGELFSITVHGFAEPDIISSVDHLPLCLNEGLSLLLSLGGEIKQIQGSFDLSSAARSSGWGGPDHIGLQAVFHKGGIGQLLVLLHESTQEPGWSVTLLGSGGEYTFRLPLCKDTPLPNSLDDFVPAPRTSSLFSLRTAVAEAYRQGGAAIRL